MAWQYQKFDQEMREKSVPAASDSRLRELADPGRPKNSKAPIHPVHPRHPRASIYGSEVTRKMTLHQRFVPPTSPALDETAEPIDSQDEDVLEPNVIPRPILDSNWPLPKPSVPSSSDFDPFSSAPGYQRVPPKRPPRPDIDSSVSSLLSARNSPTDPESPSTSTDTRSIGRDWDKDGSDTPTLGQTILEDTPFPETESHFEAFGSTPQFKRAWSQGPPSSRRGRSALFSQAPPVAPIAEERLSSGSLTSCTSSAAMPDFIYTDPGQEETENDGRAGSDREGMISDPSHDGETRSQGEADDTVDSSRPPSGHRDRQPLPPPHVHALNGESSFADTSSDSSTFLTHGQTPGTSPGTTSHLVPTPITVPEVARSPASVDLEELRKDSGSPQPAKRLNARRPPRLDIDAVKAAEARGSLTSLPDLIMRATRLAAMIDKGKRPTSRHNELDFLGEKGDSQEHRRNSGLSDMLASFPPPAETPTRGNGRRGSSFFGGSWPRLPGVRDRGMMLPELQQNDDGENKRRRCCGLPVWAVVLISLAILGAIVVVVVLPLELVAFKKHDSTMSLRDCQKSLDCLHGGTNVVFQNTCSCICANGYTGSNCNTAASEACVQTNLVATDGSSRVNNVTLGRAIPRVIADSGKNFSIPLMATMILAKFNSANLSCDSQNSLITFDGQYTRIGAANAPVRRDGAMDEERVKKGKRHSESTGLSPRSAQSTEEGLQASTSEFLVTEEVLDFARTAVLYVLQEQTVDSATRAQARLEHLFIQAATAKSEAGDAVTVEEASSLNIGGENTINLVSYSLDAGQGEVGHANARKRHGARDLDGDGDFIS